MTDPDFRGGGIDESSYRLPRSAAPRRYEISLRPDLDAGTFAGSERVEIDVTEPVRELVCNAADLEISSALLHAEGGDVLEAAVTLDAENERATFTLPGEISPGAYALEVEFAGALNEKLRGFYRSTFTDESGRERVIAASQFEVTDARLAFPCWDEPDRKAVFAITLAAPAGIGAWSNGRLVSEADAGDGWTQFRFADTIPMSTYLAAFIVGPLVQTEPRDVDGVALSVVHSPDKPPLTDFALEVAAHALRFFTEFFQIPYPGDKLDLVALPDFSTGAMENLGCITFREPYLLVDPEKAARTELEHVAEVIEHEIAHMWFGDLVTMRWWNGIWLNEAFATFMAALCLDDFRPEWKRWVSFGQDKSAAMTIDGLPSTRPIEFPVRKPDECDAMFDVLTYEKGASVLRMLERYLEPGQFREGVRRYLDAHRYGNTETTDLWDAIESATTEPVRALMDSWIFQGGYPLVRVRPRPGDRLGVAEAPFSYLPADGTVPAGAAPHAEDATAGGPDLAGAAGGVDPAGSVAGPAGGIGTQWFVPVLVEERGAAGEAPAPSRLLLAEPEGDLELHDQRSLAVVNAGGSGFYRLRYEEGLFEKVMGSLDRLTELERYNLVADTWACALAGVGPLEDFLHVVRKLKGEADPSVWSIVTSALVRIDHAVADDEREILQRLVRSLLGPRLATIGWDRAAGEDPRTPTLRSLLIASLGNVGEDPDIIERCRELFEEESAGSRQIAGDTATAVLAIVAAHGGEDEFTAILERYRNPADPQDEMRRLHALGSVRDPRLVADIHRLSLTEVRSQNGPYLLRDMMALNRPAAVQTWRFIEGEFEAMRSRFPKNSLPRMFEGVAGLDELDANDDAVVAADVRSFLAAHPFGGQQLRVDQSFERLEVNVRFAKRQRSSVGKLLDRA